MRVYLETTGCRLSQADRNARPAVPAGWARRRSTVDKHLCVVNTCAVTRGRRAPAQPDSPVEPQQSRRADCGDRLLHTSPQQVGALPGVTHTISNLDRSAGADRAANDVLADVFDREPLDREVGAGALGRTRLCQVQDGCNNRCILRNDHRTRAGAQPRAG